MKATTTARIIDILLSPVLMFGWLGSPEFGVAGVAIANLVGQGVGAIFNLEALATGRGNSRLHLSLREYRFDPKLSWRLVRLGLPATVNSIERSAAQVILLGLMSPFGDVALAAYALTQRAQIAVNLGTQGLGNAAGIIAGQNLGAQNVARAKTTVRWALSYVFVVKLIVVATLWTFPTLFLGIFNDDPELLKEGSVWLRILLIGYLAQGPVQVLMQSFQVAGDTVMPMFTTLLAMWVIEVPLAIVLTGAADLVHPFGLTLPFPTFGNLREYGIAVAIVAADFTRLSIYLPYFQWGPWYKKRILEGVRGRGGPEAIDAPLRGGGH
jgi:Na+-driven multidrug efflux pump